MYLQALLLSGSAVENLPATQERFNPWVGKVPWRRAWQPTLVWRIPWTEEPGGLQSMGSQSQM